MKKRIEQTRLLTLGNAKSYAVADSGTIRGIRPPRMLVRDFMPAGMLCGLTSFPGVGKTWLALDLTRAVVTGGKVMDEYQVIGGPQGVLVIGSDSSESDYARQWVRLTEREHVAWLNERDALAEGGAADAELPPDPFERVKFLIQSPFMLDNTDEVRRLIRTVMDEKIFPVDRKVIQTLRDEEGNEDELVEESGRCALIVMDTLSRLTMANQNDNTEMERVFANIRCICEVTGAAVLVLHHNSKQSEFNDGTDWRGAMSQIGALDSWINLSAHKAKRGLVRAEFKKFRGITPDSFEYTMHVSDPDTAKLTFNGRSSGYFGTDDLKEELVKEFTDWKTVAAVEEKLWAAHSDKFTDRGKFKKAIKNRLGDLFPATLTRRGQARAYEYKVKDTCPPSSETQPTSSAPGSIPTT